jgi:hypothetical protein
LLIFEKEKLMLNPFKNKKFEVKLVDEIPTPSDQNSTPIVEEGITLTKSEILTAVVVLTLVNGVVAMGVAKIVKGS